MPTRLDIDVKNLILDQRNRRIVKQSSQGGCLTAIYNSNRRQFILLVKNILDKGFLGGEAILVSRENNGAFIVREGNRRVSALKLLCGFREFVGKDIPDELSRLRKEVSKEWKRKNRKINCLVFDHTTDDEQLLKEEIDNRHLSNSVGRVPWPSVHKAREEKARYGTKNLALELLEKFFSYNDGLDEQWSPFFNLTVLEDFMPHLVLHLCYASKDDLVADYPNEDNRHCIDKLLHRIYGGDEESEEPLDDDLKISKLENRRGKASVFLEKVIPCDRVEGYRPVQEKGYGNFSHAGGEGGNFVSDQVDSLPPDGKPPKKRKQSISMDTTRELLAYASKTQKPKLSCCCSELYSLTKSPIHYPNSSAIIYRSILDYAMKHFIKKCGQTPPKNAGTSTLAQHIYDKKLVTETNFLNVLIDLKTDGANTLNKFVHDEDFIVSNNDAEVIIANIFPLIKHMLEIIAKSSSSSSGAGM